MIESTKRKLKLEQKVKQAAQSLYRLETAANKRQRVDTPAAASAHLDTAQKKCDEINQELWKLSASSMEIERRLLNHNAAVLGLGMSILERKATESGITDEFGEGHLYMSNDHEERPSSRRSSARLSMSERTPPRQVTAPPRTITVTVPPPEFTEAHRRLRELNFQVATMTQSDIETPTPSTSDNILTLIESLDTHIRSLAESHIILTRDLQTSLSESQRMIEQLKLRERDQSAAIADHTVRTEDLDRRLVQTQLEFDRVQNELDEQDAVIENLRQDLEIAKEEARIAETAAQGREAESLRREKSLRRGEIDRFTAELDQKDVMIAELTKDITSLRSQFEQSRSQAKSLESKLEEQSREHDVLIRDLETQLVLLKSETAMLKAEKDEILGSRKQRAQEAKLQRDLELQREKLSQTSHSEQLLLADIESLKSSNKQLSDTLDRLQSDHITQQDSLTDQIAVLERQLSMSRSQDARSSMGSNDSSRERELEMRCSDLQAELSGILDDFERLTSQFIDHESFRSTLEGQVDSLRAQCHALQTELAEEKVRMLGQRGGNDNSSLQGGGGPGQTSTVTLRVEFRKMVSELRNEHIAALKACIPLKVRLMLG
jgi:chromosome segregation ATPase